jgi:hypothetical protein
MHLGAIPGRQPAVVKPVTSGRVTPVSALGVAATIDPGNWCGSQQGVSACAPLQAESSGTTMAAVSATIAPSSTIPSSVTNVATALNVSPATIQGDTSGFWQGFYAALAKASIDPVASSAAIIQAAYQQYAGVSSTSDGSDTTLLLLISAAAILFVMSLR